MTSGQSLVGREVEEHLIDTLVSGAAGDGALVFAGEPGAGKTALLNVAEQAAAAAGFQVIRTTGVEFDADVSFAGLSEIFRGASGTFTELSPTHRDALRVVLGLGQGAVPSTLMIANATLSALESFASRQPTMLLVDDLQWLDRASAVAVSFAARRMGPNLRFIGAARIQSMFAERTGLARHDVLALTDQAAGELIGTRFPLLTARTRQRLLTEAQGNPLALIELAIAATVDARNTAPDTPTYALPLNERLKALYANRIQALPASTREVLLLAALNGTGELSVLAPTAPGGVLTTLAPAERDRLVSVHKGGRNVVFRHPLVRSTVVELARDIERRRAHYTLASALIDQPERHAWHLAEAIGGPDERVASLLESAARRSLGRGDAVLAVELLIRASEVSPDSPERSRRLIEAACLRADVTGDLGSASEMLSAAVQDEPALTDSLLAATAAAHILVNAECRVDTAHRLLVAAIGKHPRRADPTDSDLIDAFYALIMVCWMSGRAQMWAPLDAAIARLSSPAPTHLTLCRSTFGDPAHLGHSIVSEVDAALAGLQHESNPVTIIRTHLSCVYVDRLGDCREALRRVVRDGREGGAVALAINALIGSSVDNWWTGRWDEVEQLTAEGTVLCERHGYRRYSFVLGDYIGALVSAARGDHGVSTEAADKLSDMASVTGCGVAEEFAHHLRTISAIAGGDFEEAYLHATAISPAGILAKFTPHAFWVLLDLVEAAVRTGRLHEARAHVEAMHNAGIAQLSTRLALVYTACSAMAGPTEEASALFESALAVAGASRWQFDYARVQLAYGEHLRATHSVPEAQTQLAAALQIFEGLGAQPWVTRAARTLRASGLSSLIGDIAVLTERDRQIATLAASGLTNKQIGKRLNMSHRSVGGHLYRIFPLLGVASRAALHEALDLGQKISQSD